MQEYIHTCAYSYLYIHTQMHACLRTRVNIMSRFLQNRLAMLLRHANLSSIIIIFYYYPKNRIIWWSACVSKYFFALGSATS